MTRQLTNTSLMAQPDRMQDQELYCRAHHLTYSREHMLMLLMKLMDHFPNADLNFINLRLHKLEVIHVQLCRCPHHKKFRELTQYKSSSVQNWTQSLKVHQRDEDTPTRMRLGGLKKQFVLPQIWDCARAGAQIAKYIPDRIKAASEGSLIINMINHMAPAQATLARLMWCINEYSESLIRQNSNSLLGKIWTRSATYRTFVRIFRTRPRGPIYGIPIAPFCHSSQAMNPAVPTMIDQQNLAVTPPKKPRTETLPELTPLEIPLPAMTTLNSKQIVPNPQMVLNPNVSYIYPNHNAIPPNTAAKRKVEEIRSEALLNQTLEQPAVFKTPLPRIINTGTNRMRTPPGIRTQPLPPDQRHFPPGPQKALRVPTKILRRKESEYERGSLRVQTGKQNQTPTNVMREVTEVQQMQKMLTAEEQIRGRRDQEMSTPIHRYLRFHVKNECNKKIKNKIE